MGTNAERAAAPIVIADLLICLIVRIFAKKTISTDMNYQLLQAVMIPLDKIENNTGQVDGLPANPRKCAEKDLRTLKKSLKETPEMLGARELLVVPHGDKYVVVGGNMRLRALQAIGETQAPCKILPEGADLKAILIKDNVSNGDWDNCLLQADWDLHQLSDWGLEVKQQNKDNPYSQGVASPIYEPKGEKPTIAECVNLDDVKSKIAAIDAADIPEEIKEMLKATAYRLAEINFKNMAEFYAQADADVQRLMEDQCLVIVDFNKAIENGWIKMDAKFAKLYKDEQ